MKRPPTGVREPRRKTLIVRMTDKEWKRVIAASAGARSLSEYLREKLLSSSGHNGGAPRG